MPARPMEVNGEERISLAEGLAAAGLSKAVLHAWERRFAVTLASRTQAGWRYFTPQQLQRLTLLRECVDRGARIGTIMDLPDTALRDHIRESDRARSIMPLLDLVRALDETKLAAELKSALQSGGVDAFVTQTAPTLMREIGEQWKAGELPVRAEHMGSHVLASILHSILDATQAPASSPRAIVGTLPDEQHELGALSLTIQLRRLGIAATYLGGAMPIEEIAAMAGAKSSDVVAISCPTGQRGRVIGHLLELRSRLRPEQALWAGGAAMVKVDHVEGVSILRSAEEMALAVDRIRARSGS